MKPILFILFLLLIPGLQAYTVKYYSMPADSCSSLLAAIPPSYFEGLKQISFFDRNPPKLLGVDYPNYIIIYNGCNKETVIHELAHHQQRIQKDSFSNMIRHAGNFSHNQALIWQNSQK